MLIVQPQHVIFACDGVLIDSMGIITACLTEALAEAGLVLEPDEVRLRFADLPVGAVVSQVEATLGTPLSEGWADRLRAETLLRIKFRGRPVQYVADAVRTIQARGVRTTACSAAALERITVPLGMTGLLGLFNPRLYSAAMFDREDISRDLYQLASRQSGIVPNRTVVVESTPAGVEAAVAAGMSVFGYAGDRRTDAEALAAAGATVFRDMRKLPGLLMLG